MFNLYENCECGTNACQKFSSEKDSGIKVEFIWELLTGNFTILRSYPLPPKKREPHKEFSPLPLYYCSEVHIGRQIMLLLKAATRLGLFDYRTDINYIHVGLYNYNIRRIKTRP